MIEKRKWLWPLLILVALVQSAALFKIVYDRDSLLKTGREITVPVRPVDPRDLFRGDYARLGYDVSMLRQSNMPAGVTLYDFQRGGSIYVTLTPDGAGGWKVAGASSDYPKQVTTSDVVLRGVVETVWKPKKDSDVQVNVRYGIETYFVPEGTGSALETEVRSGKIDAIVAVDDSGTAALKGVVIDGKRHVDPPLL
jgi:uncharacterized membrane-anchored protein